MNKNIADYYNKDNLIGKILTWLENSGADMNDLARSELRKYDHFHTEGSKATIELADFAQLPKGAHILDIGCGIGGPLRKLVEIYNITGVGIDLTEQFVEAAEVLTKMIGMERQLSFLVADAVSLPFENDSFDALLIQHVGMNIADKQKLHSEMRRVVKKDGLLMFQEIVRKNAEPLTYPSFWALDESQSLLSDEPTLKEDLARAQFQQLNWKEITDSAIGFYEMMLIAMDKKDRPKPSLGEIMHGDNRLKTENILVDLKAGKIGAVMGAFKAV